MPATSFSSTLGASALATGDWLTTVIDERLRRARVDTAAGRAAVVHRAHGDGRHPVCTGAGVKVSVPPPATAGWPPARRARGRWLETAKDDDLAGLVRRARP